MTDSLYPITTGLSIALMNQFDTYRASSVQLLTNSQFPEDITIALRQQINKDIDATVDRIALNPRQPTVVVAPVEPPLPKVTVANTPVLIETIPAVAPAPVPVA